MLPGNLLAWELSKPEGVLRCCENCTSVTLRLSTPLT